MNVPLITLWQFRNPFQEQHYSRVFRSLLFRQLWAKYSVYDSKHIQIMVKSPFSEHTVCLEKQMTDLASQTFVNCYLRTGCKLVCSSEPLPSNKSNVIFGAKITYELYVTVQEQPTWVFPAVWFNSIMKRAMLTNTDSVSRGMNRNLRILVAISLISIWKNMIRKHPRGKTEIYWNLTTSEATATEK